MGKFILIAWWILAILGVVNFGIGIFIITAFYLGYKLGDYKPEE